MIDAYLSLLGLPRAAPSAEYLFAIHRAHVSRVPYTNLEIMRGNVTPVDLESSVRQVLAGKGGYCFHLNGALAWLLRELGFTVTLHRGYVRNHGTTDAPALNHLVLLVHGPGHVWLADAGLGDGLHEPLPLAAGFHRQGPFRYELVGGPRWRFLHDPTGSFQAMEFDPVAADIDDFAAAHHRLSTAPDSSFRRFLTAQLRTGDRISILRGCTHTVIDKAGRHERTLDTLPDWQAALTSLRLPDCGDLWPSEREAHQSWLASR